MPNYQRKEIVPGLFVLAAAAVFALYAFRVGRWEVLDFLKGQRIACRTVFDEVKTLVVGAKVVVAGRRVGAVNRLAWTEQEYQQEDLDRLRRQLGTLPADIHVGARHAVVEVDFELSDPDLRIDPASAVVAIQQDGFLGQHYLDLYPGFWPPDRAPAPILSAGLEAPLRVRSRRTAGLEQLASTVGDAVGELERLAHKLDDEVLSAANRDMLAALLRGTKEAADELRGLLAADGDLRVRTLQPLQRLLESSTEAVASVRETTLPRATQLLDESRAGVQDFRGSMAAVQKDLHAVLDQLHGAVLDNRPELAESVQRLRSTLWQAEMAMRRIRANPSVLLFGGTEPDLEARTMDESGARATGRARIFQQRDESATGR
jgi:ABC-type transporter Mla subunit MlaD